MVRDTILAALRRTGLYSSVALRRSGALAEDGWFRSFRDHRSTDRRGNPLPWMTYPTIHFLDGRLSGELRVFEYGSGNSTLWWAARVGHIHAIEHDPGFLDELRSGLPANAEIEAVTDPDAYVRRAATTEGRWDVVVVDGERRDDCIPHAVAGLSDSGVVLLDDTEGNRWAAGKRFMADSGFRRLDFVGLRPMHISQSSTTIFYRNGNCLGI